jgi:tRNA-2-methylthio-N6-dimethylallyladenosine synthase
LTIAVAGCVAQQEGAGCSSACPTSICCWAGQHSRVAALAARGRGCRGAGRPHEFDLTEPHFLAAAAEPGRTPVSAFVTVMKGCNERCTYCIVPHTRGPERYRPAREIVDEVRRLVAAGAARNHLARPNREQLSRSVGRALAGAGRRRGAVAAYARPARSRGRERVRALVRAIAAQVPELLRLRYTSPHPRHLTVSLIRAHQDLPVLARHVHLPVQAGSDRVLRRMLRATRRRIRRA